MAQRVLRDRPVRRAISLIDFFSRKRSVRIFVFRPLVITSATRPKIRQGRSNTLVSFKSASLRSGGQYWSARTVQMRRKDGTAIWIHLQGTPLKERPGESLWMMTDVTEQHV